MKKIVLMILLVSLSLAFLNASGKDDDSNDQYRGRGGGGPMMGEGFNGRYDDKSFEERQKARLEYLETLPVISISGNLQLMNGEFPFLQLDGVKYYVKAPLYQISELELVHNMEITLEGYEMPAMPLQWDGSVKSIMVTKATVNGEEIAIEHMTGDRSFYGGFGACGRGRSQRQGSGFRMGLRN